MDRDECLSLLKSKFGDKKGSLYEKKLYNMCVKQTKISQQDVMTVYREVVYEKIGHIMTLSDDAEQLQSIFQDVDTSYMTSAYDQYQKTRCQELRKINTKVESVKGLYKCKEPNCKGDEFIIWSEQNRSGDEGMTHYRKCVRCGKRKKEIM